jgi:hypothetical protein
VARADAVPVVRAVRPAAGAQRKNEYIKARVGSTMREAFKAGVKVALAPMRAPDRTVRAVRSSPRMSSTACRTQTRSVRAPSMRPSCWASPHRAPGGRDARRHRRGAG